LFSTELGEDALRSHSSLLSLGLSSGANLFAVEEQEVRDVKNLIDLRATMNGRRVGWADLESHNDPSQCKGVEADEDGRVIGLDFDESSFPITLPSVDEGPGGGELPLMELLNRFEYLEDVKLQCWRFNRT
jgi:hypothetical protein